MDRCIDRYGRRALATTSAALGYSCLCFQTAFGESCGTEAQTRVGHMQVKGIISCTVFSLESYFYLFLFMIHLGLKGRNCFPLTLAQGPLLVVPGPYTMVVIKLGLATCKVSTTVLYICDPGQVYLKREFH